MEAAEPLKAGDYNYNRYLCLNIQVIVTLQTFIQLFLLPNFLALIFFFTLMSTSRGSYLFRQNKETVSICLLTSLSSFVIFCFRIDNSLSSRIYFNKNKEHRSFSFSIASRTLYRYK